MEPSNPMVESRRTYSSLQTATISNPCHNDPDSLRFQEAGTRNNQIQHFDRFPSQEKLSKIETAPHPAFF